MVIRHSTCINSADINSAPSTETAVSHTLRYLLSTSIYEVEIISSTLIDRALNLKNPFPRITQPVTKGAGIWTQFCLAWQATQTPLRHLISFINFCDCKQRIRATEKAAEERSVFSWCPQNIALSSITTFTGLYL